MPTNSRHRQLCGYFLSFPASSRAPLERSSLALLLTYRRAMRCSRRWRRRSCSPLACLCRSSYWRFTPTGCCFMDSLQPVSGSGPPKHVLASKHSSCLGLAVSVFLPLGPFGQGGYGLLLVGDLYRRLLPQSTSPDSILAEPGFGIALQAINFVFAFMLWVIGIWFLIPATVALSTSRGPPFGLPYWGLIFPSVSTPSTKHPVILTLLTHGVTRAYIPCLPSNSEPKSIQRSFTSSEPFTPSPSFACSQSSLSRPSSSSVVARCSTHLAWMISHWHLSRFGRMTSSSMPEHPMETLQPLLLSLQETLPRKL